MTVLPIVPFDRDAHETALFAFLERSLGAGVTRNRKSILTWMHDRMPGRERAPVRYVIVDGERVVGSLGHMPADFMVKGRIIPARYTHDLLIDPDYRVWGRLAQRIIENALGSGEFFPGGLWMTDASHKLHLAGGFDDAKPLVTQTLVLDPDAFVARKELSGVKAGVGKAALCVLRARALRRAAAVTSGRGVRTVDAFDPALDDAWRDMLAGYGIGRVRDAAYLNWKYASHPVLDYRLCLSERDGRTDGYMVWRLPRASDPEKRAVVVDFLVENGGGDALRRLVSEVVVEASGAGAGILSFLTTQPWAARVLRSLGFLPRSGKQSWVVGGWSAHIPANWLTNHAAWHVCSGDSDGDMWTGSQ